MNVEVVTPDAYMGDVLGDLSSRRGKIGGMTQRGEAQVIAATRAARRDVRVLDEAALDVAGPRGVLDGVRALRGSAEDEGGRDRREGEGVSAGRVGAARTAIPTRITT